MKVYFMRENENGDLYMMFHRKGMEIINAPEGKYPEPCEPQDYIKIPNNRLPIIQRGQCVEAIIKLKESTNG
jgi:hypothetical protein